ncbi:MAG TPA: NUDIX domain-containing protein [Stenomitos sp.]
MTYSPSISEPHAEFKVGVDNVIFSVDTAENRLLVLLTQRQQDPYAETWALPGTLVRQRESLEEAAYRNLAEKLQVDHLYLEQLYTFSEAHSLLQSTPNRYLSVSYFALVRYEAATITTQAIYPLAWHPVEELPPLAFNHADILTYGRQRLCNKLEYSPIAFDVLPKTFTLNDLYQLYCTVLGENFSDYSNFRSRLLKLGFLLDTGQKVTRGAGRPASLYQFDAHAFAPLKDKPFMFI